MNILICGATGFIGRNMVEYFSGLGHEIHAVRWNRPEYGVPGVIWHRTDLRKDSYEVKQILDGVDVVIQAAATTSGSKDIVNNPAIHVTDNVVMNAYIFRAAVEAKVKHVIFFSCSTMFSNGVVTEDSPIDIHPKYFGVAHTKLYNEKMCEFYAGIGNTKFTAIRHSNIYGPHDKFDLERSHVFGATITKVMTGTNKVTVWGTGEESRDLLYVDDLCEFVQSALNKQPEKFGLYNCGSGFPFPIKSLVKDIIKASGKDLIVDHDLSAPTIPTSLSMDCYKARKELGWSPKVAIDEGIRLTIDWWKQNYENRS